MGIKSISLAATALVLSASVDAATIIDQQQSIIDSTVGGLIIGGASEQMLAQTATTGTSGSLVEIRLPISGDSGDLIVEIQGVSAGVPDGVVLTSESFGSASFPRFFPSPPTFRTLAFSSPVTFSAGDVFSIVLKSTGTFGISKGPEGDSYGGGEGYFDATSGAFGWAPFFTRLDLPFQTVVETVSAPTVIDPTATVAGDAMIGAGSTVGAGAVIERGVIIGEGSSIGVNVTINKNVTLGDNAVIGDGSTIHKDVIAGDYLTVGTNVSIHKDVVIGSNVTIGDNSQIHSNTVIGNSVYIGVIGGGVGVFVGNRVTISREVVIVDGDTIPNDTTVP